MCCVHVQRERKERQRAEAERAERGKAEREKAAQERKAARAKAAAERAKAFTVVFGTSAGGSAFSSSTGRSSSKRDAMRQSIDSTGAHSDSDRQAAAGPEAAAGMASTSSPAGAAAAAVARGGAEQVQEPGAHPVPLKRWGPSNKQQQEQLQQEQARAVRAAVAGGNGVGVQPDAAGITAVDVAHARCDSYDILGDEHSKLGLDMLALLDLPEVQLAHSATAAAAAAQQQLAMQLQLQQHHNQLQQQQAVRSGSGDAPCHVTDADSSQQGGGSRPATPKFNLLDLGGVSWGMDAADSTSALNQQAVRPASAGGCIMSLSPGAAAAARATAAMDSSARPSLDLPSGAAGGSQAGLWRSPLGLGIDGPSLPPLAPRAPHLRHAGRSLTDDGGGSLRQQQHVQVVQGANSFDPISSPAGRISPVGTAVTSLGACQLPEPAFMYAHSSAAGLSSPGSYAQLQQAHPSLLQHQLTAQSRSSDGGALLTAFDDSTSRTAAAITSMEGGSQGWLQQQQQMSAAPGPLLGGSGSGGQDGLVSCFASMPMQSPALGGADARLFEQQQLCLLQMQQQQQQQASGHLRYAGGDLCGTANSLAAALLPPPAMSMPLAAPTSAALACQSPASLGSQAGGVGALSGTFAFGAPYSSSFSPAPFRGSGSLGGAADGLAAQGAPIGGLQPHGHGSMLASAAGGGAAGVQGGLGSVHGQGAAPGANSSSSDILRPELLLPDDLNFSPPSSGPARWMQG